MIFLYRDMYVYTCWNKYNDFCKTAEKMYISAKKISDNFGSAICQSTLVCQAGFEIFYNQTNVYIILLAIQSKNFLINSQVCEKWV